MNAFSNWLWNVGFWILGTLWNLFECPKEDPLKENPCEFELSWEESKCWKGWGRCWLVWTNCVGLDVNCSKCCSEDDLLGGNWNWEGCIGWNSLCWEFCGDVLKGSNPPLDCGEKKLDNCCWVCRDGCWNGRYRAFWPAPLKKKSWPATKTTIY